MRSETFQFNLKLQLSDDYYDKKYWGNYEYCVLRNYMEHKTDLQM